MVKYSATLPPSKARIKSAFSEMRHIPFFAAILSKQVMQNVMKLITEKYIIKYRIFYPLQ